ncbi:urocortin 3, like [Syngnathoides biaculeatus]|uniref:urocortin 3, like n=1 Tax=Syngnathoides biaculeatus TaxID=300417 RepID=UPI002ADD9AB4|nr:urocortin 3, like [Syngnathoides biaculeatus]
MKYPATCAPPQQKPPLTTPHAMLSSLKTLLLLSVLCSPSSNLCLRLARGRSDVLCERRAPGGISPEDAWGSLPQSPADYLADSAASREKRTYGAGAKARFLKSRAKLRGGGAGQDERRSGVTLSLDVPTNIMNVIFEMVKARKQREKAAENARLLAQIGRRK